LVKSSRVVEHQILKSRRGKAAAADDARRCNVTDNGGTGWSG
jgi:hypothetical protein